MRTPPVQALLGEKIIQERGEFISWNKYTKKTIAMFKTYNFIIIIIIIIMIIIIIIKKIIIIIIAIVI